MTSSTMVARVTNAGMNGNITVLTLCREQALFKKKIQIVMERSQLKQILVKREKLILLNFASFSSSTYLETIWASTSIEVNWIIIAGSIIFTWI